MTIMDDADKLGKELRAKMDAEKTATSVLKHRTLPSRRVLCCDRHVD
jgi:hypothetical protein